MSMEPIVTRVGFADFGDYDHFGKRLYRDIAGRTSFLGLAVFAICGRLLPPEDVAVIDDVAVCMHCPEPRVWPAKLGRIAASAGRFPAGMVVGWSALDSEIGVHLGDEAAQMLLDLLGARVGATDRPRAMAAFVQERGQLPGFGVHGRRVDERVEALRACLVRRGRAGGQYWMLAEALWPVAHAVGSMDPSIWAAVGAVLLDLALEPRHIGPLLSLLFQPSYLAHAVEGAQLKSPSLQRLPPEAVRYVGVPPRQSPRALAAGPTDPSPTIAMAEVK
jgi:hypothetical protein